MKTIFLLRHAQAAPVSYAHAGGDKERDLTPQGLTDARAMGAYMAEKGYGPDLVLCSGAERTRQTCAQMLDGLERGLDVRFMDEIYNASCGGLFSMLQGADDACSSLMLIGHNPSIYELAARLSSRGSDDLLDRLGRGFSPATLCVIEVECEAWADLELEGQSLVDYVDPSCLGLADIERESLV